MENVFTEGYCDNPALKAAFMRFLVAVFGLDLGRWDSLGYWDNSYRPFSFFDGDKVASSLCLYSMDMTVLGVRRRVAQMSAVGTLPEYRRRGLSAELMRRAIAWARPDHDFFFLFSDEGVTAFYSACGFHPVTEYRSIWPITPREAIPGARRLDTDRAADRALIFRCATERTPVSDLLAVHNEKLLMFWCLYGLRDATWYVEPRDLLVLARREGGTLTIFDIVGREIPPFSEFYPYLADQSDRSVEFAFMPDKLGLAPEQMSVQPDVDSGLHLHGVFPLEGQQIMFPFTSRA